MPGGPEMHERRPRCGRTPRRHPGSAARSSAPPGRRGRTRRPRSRAGSRRMSRKPVVGDRGGEPYPGRRSGHPPQVQTPPSTVSTGADSPARPMPTVAHQFSARRVPVITLLGRPEAEPVTAAEPGTLVSSRPWVTAREMRLLKDAGLSARPAAGRARWR